MNATSYLRWLFGLLLACVALIGTTNAMVDPYGVLGLVRVANFNLAKPERLAHGGRIAKSVDLRQEGYETLILGSSRAQLGIDPLSGPLADARTYNGGFPAANMYEVERIGLYVLTHQRLDRVIIGLDFFQFSTHQKTYGDFSHSGLAGRPLVYTYLRELLLAGGLRDSVKTVLVNLLGAPSQNGLDGYIDGRVRYGKSDPRELFTSVLEANFFVLPELYAGFEYGPDRVDMFHDLIARFAQAGVAVHAFISPVHARQLEAIQVLGLFSTFERWKRDVVAVVEEVNGGLAQSHSAVAIWDFNGYNSVTTEVVPEEREGRPTKWFWESSHYKKEVGDLILLRMLRPEVAAKTVARDFGISLNSESLELHLEAIRRTAWRYRKSNPFEIADVEQLFRNTEAVRRSLD